MGCGCGKKSKVTPRLPQSANQAAQSSPTKTYDVVNSEGSVLASTANPVFARVEARRLGGTVVPSTTASASSA